MADDFRGTTSRMGETWDADQQIVDIVTEVARRHQATNAQMALTWLFHRAAHLGVSASTRSTAQSRER